MGMKLKRKLILMPILVLGLVGCQEQVVVTPPLDAAFLRLSAQEVAELPLAVRFELPMGGEDGALVYNAQPFRITRHLGDDWNGIGGWNSDRGDAVYASGTGRVVYAGVPGPGWGNMVILAHRVPDATAELGWSVYQTVYAHLETIEVKPGEVVPRGTRLGSVGTAGGQYWAHLHFEVRRSMTVYPGVGYSDGALDRVSPEQFIRAYGGLAGVIAGSAPRVGGD